MLSFSTHGSAKHERVEKVRRAVEIVRARAPEIAIDGELQADAALVPRVAALKVKSTERCRGAGPTSWCSRTSMLATSATSCVSTLGGMRAIGPFLQGFSRPLCDLSRGATVDDIVAAAAITAAMA